VNGQRNNANYFTVDGVSANAGISAGDTVSGNPTAGGSELAGALPGLSALGTTTTLVSVDALEEFKIQTSTYAAEFGRQPGGQVQLVTRSGGNEFHGTVFEYIRNDAFDARNYFNPKPDPKPPLRQNQFGGTLSGPVFFPNFGDGGDRWYNGKNRTFFFFSYEGLRLLLPTSGNFLVPSLRLRQAAPSVIQSLLNAFPRPTGPETLINSDPDDPTSPLVPSGAAPFLGAYSSPSRIDATSIRIDHILSNKLSLFGRYSNTASGSLNRDLSFLNGQKDKVHTLTLGLTALLSKNVTNELRFNFSHTRSSFNYSSDNFGGAAPVDPAVLTAGYSGPGPSLGRFGFFVGGAELFPGLGNQADSYQRQINIVDNLAWVKGSHQFKFGFDYRRLAPIYGPNAYEQDPFFTNENEILSATPAFVSISASQGARPLFDNYSVYGQDHWAITPRLSLDLGLRWELNPTPGEANGLKPVLVTGIGENLDVSGATLASPGTPLYRTSYTALAPRIGAAYQLTRGSGREMVLRGGFGVYYDLGNGMASAGFGGYPFTASNTLSGVPYPLSSSVATPPPFSSVTLPITDLLYVSNPNLKLPYTMEWNVAVERSLGQRQTLSVAYVASAGRRLLQTRALNPIRFTTVPFTRPNQNFGALLYTTNGPSSDYNSFQAQFQRRLSHGLQALANYTWSHAIDDVSDEVNTGGLLRGNADFDVRHLLSSAVSYQIPRLKAGPVLTPVLSHWSLDTIVYAQSGTPLNIGSGSYFNGQSLVTVQLDVLPGVPIWINDSSVPGGKRLNLAAFALPPFTPGLRRYVPLRQGTLGRNSIRQPGFYQINIALGRKFNLTERLNLELKAEAFNVLNRPIFSSRDTNFFGGNTMFGVPTATLSSALGGLNPLYQMGGMRSMQFSARLRF